MHIAISPQRMMNHEDMFPLLNITHYRMGTRGESFMTVREDQRPRDASGRSFPANVKLTVEEVGDDHLLTASASAASDDTPQPQDHAVLFGSCHDDTMYISNVIRSPHITDDALALLLISDVVQAGKNLGAQRLVVRAPSADMLRLLATFFGQRDNVSAQDPGHGSAYAHDAVRRHRVTFRM